MGQFEDAKRSMINEHFEAMAGDMQGDVEPIFITSRSTQEDQIRAERVIENRVMKLSYKILEPSIDNEDLIRIFHITYLDWFTMHYYQDKIDTIEFTNSDTSTTIQTPYPDPE